MSETQAPYGKKVKELAVLPYNMISAAQARDLASDGYLRSTAKLHQEIRERALEGFTELRIYKGKYPDGIIKDLIHHGYVVDRSPKETLISIKW